GVGEGAVPVALAERPDSGDARPQHLVDDDVTALVRLHPGALEGEIVGVRPPADGEERVRPDDDLVPLLAVDADANPYTRGLERDALRVETQPDALALHDLLDRARHVFVLAIDEPRGPLDDRDLRPEAAVHLREFEADVASADDGEVLRDLVQRQ